MPRWLLLHPLSVLGALFLAAMLGDPASAQLRVLTVLPQIDDSQAGLAIAANAVSEELRAIAEKSGERLLLSFADSGRPPAELRSELMNSDAHVVLLFGDRELDGVRFVPGMELRPKIVLFPVWRREEKDLPLNTFFLGWAPSIRDIAVALEPWWKKNPPQVMVGSESCLQEAGVIEGVESLRYEGADTLKRLERFSTVLLCFRRSFKQGLEVLQALEKKKLRFVLDPLDASLVRVHAAAFEGVYGAFTDRLQAEPKAPRFVEFPRARVRELAALLLSISSKKDLDEALCLHPLVSGESGVIDFSAGHVSSQTLLPGTVSGGQVAFLAEPKAASSGGCGCGRSGTDDDGNGVLDCRETVSVECRLSGSCVHNGKECLCYSPADQCATPLCPCCETSGVQGNR